MNRLKCPALLIAAPASNQGKTTVTAALGRHLRDRGMRLRVFKVGPDFLDPMILEQASGAPVYQLDLWMGGERHCRELLAAAAREADLILIEGVMGLFDGEPSSADLAARFGIPVMSVIDASAMAQTFGAVAFGLARFRPRVPFAGVFANRIGNAHHASMAAHSLPDNLPLLGWLPRAADFALPERHLGLLPAAEIADLETRVAAAAAAIEWQGKVPPVEFQPLDPEPLPRLLDGVRIAIARDAAFSFLYQANLDLLHDLGAEIRYFSPLTDPALPPADSLYLPGGYPELHLEALQANRAMRDAIRRHHESGGPILAECGGMLYLTGALVDGRGRRAEMAAILPGTAVMQPELAALALQRVELPEGPLRGHTFHFSRLESTAVPLAHGICPNGGRTAEPVYRSGRLTASYIHFYFPSNAHAVAGILKP